jgi:hypothetical protein
MSRLRDLGQVPPSGPSRAEHKGESKLKNMLP